MDLKEYQEFCRKTAIEFEDKDKEIFTWGLGISGEAGDVAGCIKKTVSHNDDQRAGIKENLGDTLWYIAMICNYYNWRLEEVLAENIEKLERKFPKGFTSEDAQKEARKDWMEKE